jgi:hypothetical protein
MRDKGCSTVYWNNRAKNLHQAVRRRGRKRQWFKSARSAQRFLSIHAAAHTTCYPDKARVSHRLPLSWRHQLPEIRLSGDGADPNSALRRPLETPNVTALTSASASGNDPLISRRCRFNGIRANENICSAVVTASRLARSRRGDGPLP